MTIGDLAAAAGVGLDTVRYYERRGLLPAPARSASGYRQYGASDLARLQQVLRAKALGFTLAEIRELAEDADGVLAAAKAKLADIDRQRRELTVVRGRLDRLVGACEDGSEGCASLLV